MSGSTSPTTVRTGDTSGVATPSTAASSVQGQGGRRGGKGRLEEDEDEPMEDDDEEEQDEDEAVVVPGSRSTPRRTAALKASKKLVLPPLDLEDLPVIIIDSDDEDVKVTGSAASSSKRGGTNKNSKPAPKKGKGKEEVIIIDSDSGSDEFKDDGDEEEEDDEDSADEEYRQVVQLAKKLAGDSITKSVTKFKLSVPLKAGKKVETKGKGKGKAKEVEVEAIVIDDSDSEGSDYKDIDMSGRSLAASDATSEDSDDPDQKVPSTSSKSAPLKIAPRKGVVVKFSKGKGKGKKLTQFEKTELMLHANHPELIGCWDTLEALPKRVPSQAAQPGGLTQELLPFQLEGVDWLIKQEKSQWAGGLLADEMGMGKTIQMISLILSDYTPDSKKSTLVLAPTVAIMQWKNEIAKFTKGFKVYVYHGSNRLDNVKEMQKYDVVLTSYAVMESAFRRENKGFQRKGALMKEDSIIHKMKWHRVILDEAHNIKDRGSNTAKAAFALTSRYRWCLSGTPLQNRVGELYSLVRFIGADPFAYYYCKKCDCKSLHWLSWKGPCSDCHHSGMSILKPIQYGGATSGDGETAFKKLSILLDQLMLRRTKVERADDMGLPPRVVNVRRDYFTEEEEEIYQSLFKDVKRRFNTFADEGTVLNNYSNIFTLIGRMRLCSDHPSLVTHSKTAMPIAHAEVDLPEEIMTCRLCFDEAEDAISSACRHIYCRQCIRQYMETAVQEQPQCPVCLVPITIDLEQDAKETDTTGRQGILARIDPSKLRTSTKLEALVEELSKLRTEDKTLKSLVFSQFTSMLDLVARRLQLGGFKVVRLQGSMTPVARDNVIQHFMNNPDVTVFLISLKAGGVALNLTEASRVFILDPWWNPAVEIQSMDRIHRIGQFRPVIVTRLIIENSIESRILELQRKKENLASSTLGDDKSAMGRLTPEDLRFLFSMG